MRAGVKIPDTLDNNVGNCLINELTASELNKPLAVFTIETSWVGVGSLSTTARPLTTVSMLFREEGERSCSIAEKEAERLARKEERPPRSTLLVVSRVLGSPQR